MEFGALIRKMIDGVIAGDGDTVASCFTPDGVYHDVFYGAFEGRDRIAEMIRDYFHRDGCNFRWDTHNPVSDGTTGYVRYVLDIPDLRPLLKKSKHPSLSQYPDLAGAATAEADTLEFSDQELVILRLLAEKRMNREIAGELFISVATVKWHLWHIYRKLGVKNRRLAVARARELDLIF